MGGGAGAEGRALVTGAGGFIGRHLAATLVGSGARVRALDLELDALRALDAGPYLELLEGDVADPGLVRRALAGVQVVYHLAAAHLGASVEAAEFERVNVDAVAALARDAARAGVQRFVHCSSVGVYGRIQDPPADEGTPCHPKLAYERTKLVGEGAVLDAVRQLALPAVILRPAWVYGPGCPRTHKLFAAISAGRFVVGGSGSSLRHGVYVRDMVDAFLVAGARRDLVGEVFVIGDRRAGTVRELVDEIARLTGARPPRSLPIWALAGAATGAEVAFRALRREPPLSRRTLEFFRGNTSFRVDRALERLGWTPRYDLYAGLAETHEYWSGGEFWKLPLDPAAAGEDGPIATRREVEPQGARR